MAESTRIHPDAAGAPSRERRIGTVRPHPARRPAADCPVGRTRCARRLALVAIALLALAPLGTREAPAQDEEADRRPAIVFHRSFAVPDNRTAYDTYDEALRALAENRFAAALPKLQRLLDHYANKVVAVPRGDGEEARYHGYAVEVNRLLAGLPEDGRRIYREIYDGHAKRLFEKATASERAGRRDARALLDLVRRYRHTSIGDRAVEALADVYLERGETESAAHFYGVLARSVPEDVGDGAEVVYESRVSKLVYALALAGETERAKAEWSQRYGDRAITVGDVSWSIADAVARWAAAARPIPALAGLDETPDDTDRLVLAPSLAGVRHREWRVAIPVLHELDIAQYGNASAPFLPVAGRDKVFIQNGLQVWAYNLSDGALRWKYDGVLDRATDQPNDQLLYTGTLDGERLFTNLEVPVEAPEHYFHAIPIQKKIPMRKLFAFDADTGSLEWTHAPGQIPTSAQPDDRAFLAKTNVSSPPVVWQDSVLSGMSFFEGKIYCYLTACDKRTGNLRWRTLICTGQKTLNMFGRPVREPVLGIPCVADGVAYYTTNLGVVAAVDARSGETLWLTSYPQRKVRQQRGMIADYRAQPGWRLSPTRIRDGVVVAAPMDADHLFGFDAKTGRLLWKVNRQDGAIGLDHVIGIDGDTVYASGSGIAAFHLRTGMARWPSVPFNRQDQTSWRGVIARDGVVVPTEKHLHMVQKKDGGRVIEPPVAWDAPIEHSGNLVVAGLDTFITAGRLVASKSAYVNVFYDRNRRIQRLSELVANEPTNVGARLSLARTLAQGGDAKKALDAFDDAVRRIGSGDDTASGRLRLEALRGRYDVLSRLASAETAGERWAEAERLVDRALQGANGQPFHLEAMLAKERLLERQGKRPELAALHAELERTFGDATHAFPEWGRLPVALYAKLRIAEGHVTQNRDTDAVAAWQSIIHERPDVPLALDPPTTARDFAVRMIRETIRSSGRDCYAAFDKEAAALYAKATDRNDLTLLRRVIVTYPNATIASNARLAFAAGSRRARRPADAVRTLRRLLDRTTTDDAGVPMPSVLAELALGYRDLGLRHAATSVAARIGRDHADATIAIADERVTGRDFAKQIGEPRRVREVSDEGATKPTLRWTDVRENSVELELVRLQRIGSPRALAILTAINRDTGESVLQAIEPGDRPRVRWSVALPAGMERESRDAAVLVDDLLVFPTDRSVSAFDTRTGAMQWKHDYAARRVDGITVIDGAAIVVASVPPLATDSERKHAPVVEAIDLPTGTIAWRRRLEGEYPLRPIAVGGHVVVTVRRKPTAVHVLDGLTGAVAQRYELNDRFLAIDPVAITDRALLMSPDSRAALRYAAALGTPNAATKPRDFALEKGELETILGGPKQALVVSAIRMPENNDGGGFRHRQRVQAVTGEPNFGWRLDLDEEAILDAAETLALDDRWILPTRDLEGRVSLTAYGLDGAVQWKLDELFVRNTYRTPLYRIPGGLLAIGHDPTAQRDTNDGATTHLVALSPGGEIRTRWFVRELAKPKGAWPTENGFFLVWPHRVEFYGTTARRSGTDEEGR